MLWGILMYVGLGIGVSSVVGVFHFHSYSALTLADTHTLRHIHMLLYTRKCRIRTDLSRPQCASVITQMLLFLHL